MNELKRSGVAARVAVPLGFLAAGVILMALGGVFDESGYFYVGMAVIAASFLLAIVALSLR